METLWLEAARRLLESCTLPIKRVATLTGLSDEQTPRRAFLRSPGVAPSDYRERFRSSTSVQSCRRQKAARPSAESACRSMMATGGPQVAPDLQEFEHLAKPPKTKPSLEAENTPGTGSGTTSAGQENTYSYVRLLPIAN
ncbi:hypothetical protein [Xanthomonas arboricola]|uniref:hypothetical protein n=1 Tax=Xanthomonas arboricola TaxID=56448 RepID=UPI001EE6A6F2|nr:hypothetical protein [Xanthomonas arboricola]